MRSRWLWALTGVLAGVAGLATSLLTAALLGLRGNPVTEVAELVVRLTPGNLAEQAIRLVGHKDKPLLVTGVLLVLLLLFAAFGVLARSRPGAAVGGFVVLGVVGLIADQSQFGWPPNVWRVQPAPRTETTTPPPNVPRHVEVVVPGSSIAPAETMRLWLTCSCAKRVRIRSRMNENRS